jgi:hypothetical protein
MEEKFFVRFKMASEIQNGGQFSRTGQKIIFQIKYTRDVKSMIRVVGIKAKKHTPME